MRRVVNGCRTQVRGAACPFWRRGGLGGTRRRADNRQTTAQLRLLPLLPSAARGAPPQGVGETRRRWAAPPRQRPRPREQPRRATIQAVAAPAAARRQQRQQRQGRGRRQHRARRGREAAGPAGPPPPRQQRGAWAAAARGPRRPRQAAEHRLAHGPRVSRRSAAVATVAHLPAAVGTRGGLRTRSRARGSNAQLAGGSRARVIAPYRAW
jgi:hypothetical protein